MNGDEFAPAESELPPDMNLDDYLSHKFFSLPTEDPFTDPVNVSGGWFTAGFDGECVYGDDIEIGDTIRATDEPDEFEHKGCVEYDRAFWAGRIDGQ